MSLIWRVSWSNRHHPYHPLPRLIDSSVCSCAICDCFSNAEYMIAVVGFAFLYLGSLSIHCKHDKAVPVVSPFSRTFLAPNWCPSLRFSSTVLVSSAQLKCKFDPLEFVFPVSFNAALWTIHNNRFPIEGWNRYISEWLTPDIEEGGVECKSPILGTGLDRIGRLRFRNLRTDSWCSEREQRKYVKFMAWNRVKVMESVNPAGW